MNVQTVSHARNALVHNIAITVSHARNALVHNIAITVSHARNALVHNIAITVSHAQETLLFITSPLNNSKITENKSRITELEEKRMNKK